MRHVQIYCTCRIPDDKLRSLVDTLNTSRATPRADHFVVSPFDPDSGHSAQELWDRHQGAVDYQHPTVTISRRPIVLLDERTIEDSTMLVLAEYPYDDRREEDKKIPLMLRMIIEQVPAVVVNLQIVNQNLVEVSIIKHDF